MSTNYYQRLLAFVIFTINAFIDVSLRIFFSKIFANRIPVSITFFHLPTTLLSLPGYVLPRLSLAQSHEPNSLNHF